MSLYYYAILLIILLPVVIIVAAAVKTAGRIPGSGLPDQHDRSRGHWRAS